MAMIDVAVVLAAVIVLLVWVCDRAKRATRARWQAEPDLPPWLRGFTPESHRRAVLEGRARRWRGPLPAEMDELADRRRPFTEVEEQIRREWQHAWEVAGGVHPISRGSIPLSDQPVERPGPHRTPPLVVIDEVGEWTPDHEEHLRRNIEARRRMGLPPFGPRIRDQISTNPPGEQRP